MDGAPTPASSSQYARTLLSPDSLRLLSSPVNLQTSVWVLSGSTMISLGSEALAMAKNNSMAAATASCVITLMGIFRELVLFMLISVEDSCCHVFTAHKLCNSA